ncbi:MAG TPA: hypothetical protein VK610_04530 [Rhodothermales bacterium]|nr:hypothetical protein [Rhodothermales bacterium]
MGQQQLLLLVLGIVIVGLAVVVGIQAFGENQKKANQDALVNDGVRIASDAQAWRLKPAAFGGGASAAGLSALANNWTALGYTSSGNNYININGSFALAASGTGLLITGTSTAPDNTVYVRVCGTASTDITTSVGGSAPTACS